MLTVVSDPGSSDTDRLAAGTFSRIDQIVREDARRILTEAPRAEVDISDDVAA